MNTNKSGVEKPFWRIKFPIDVDISTSANVGRLRSGEGVSTTVHVRKPYIRFPNKCVYCGTPSNTLHQKNIRRAETRKIGSHNRHVSVLVEFKETYSIPFCQQHLNIFKQNQSLNIIGYVLGFILITPLVYLLSPLKWRLPENLGALLIAVFVGGIGSFLIAWLFRQLLATVSERFKTLRDWPWIAIDVEDAIKFLTFRFHNKDYEKEFIQINQSENPIFE